MQLGLLVTSVGAFGGKGFYNLQEVGLAKALAHMVDRVVVYKLISSDGEKRVEQIDGCINATMHFMPVKSIGNNGKINVNELDSSLDALIYFSDTQFAVPKVAKWAKKHGIALYPYIGVTESHAESKLKRLIINLRFRKNLAVYKKSHCFVKTPTVAAQLGGRGVKQVTVTPVGLDLSLLHTTYAEADVTALIAKYGYAATDRVLLFIGRFAEEKHPERMVEILRALREKDASFRLLMVGKGDLLATTKDAVKELGLDAYVKFIDRIPNSDIWELYRIADTFVNLSEHEIFGMAILEAMYYGCRVVAFHAPGPDYIIEDKVSGDLVSAMEEAEACILAAGDYASASHARIVEHFTWSSVAEQMFDIIKKESENK